MFFAPRQKVLQTEPRRSLRILEEIRVSPQSTWLPFP